MLNRRYNAGMDFNAHEIDLIDDHYLTATSESQLRVPLTSQQYYNTVRFMKRDKKAPKTIAGLLITLDQAGFMYRTRVNKELDSNGHVLSKKLIQI
jgi:hypothetical protein